MAFKMNIGPNQPDSHQTSPAYMLTFLRFGSRDTSLLDESNFLALRRPMLVINDCYSLSTQSTKKSHVHTLTMMMKGGDIDYSTALVPGDFVCVNMLDDDEKLFGKNGNASFPSADSLYSRAQNLLPINHSHDGFKGVFKVADVREQLVTNPSNSVKSVTYQVTANAFTEFNQVVYFNPYLYDKTEADGDFEKLNSNASQEHAEAVDKQVTDLRVVFKRFIGFLIGAGFPANYIGQKEGVVRNHNKNFLIPPDLGRLLGMLNVKRAADIFNYYVGVQKYANSLNPICTRDGNFLNCGSPPPGVALIQPEPWGQVTAWSILGQYSNSLINEMYTAFKLTPEGNILPCVVYRQKPYSNKSFTRKNPLIPNTEFLSLPRWHISPNLVQSHNLGRSEAARINFVHIVGKTRYVDIADYVAQQAALHSHQEDVKDVQRHGLKPFIAACDFDFPATDSKKSNSPEWNKLVFDWLQNGHLKKNGTLTCFGIHEPIAIGDNLQIDSTVYHIESITHHMATDFEGIKSFTTTFQLSYGIDERSTGDQTYFPDMTFTDSHTRNQDDWAAGDGIYPGTSDSQDIPGRRNGEEVVNTKEAPFQAPPRRKPKSTLPIYEDLKQQKKSTSQKYELPDGIKDLVKKITKF